MGEQILSLIWDYFPFLEGGDYQISISDELIIEKILNRISDLVVTFMNWHKNEEDDRNKNWWNMKYFLKKKTWTEIDFTSADRKK